VRCTLAAIVVVTLLLHLSPIKSVTVQDYVDLNKSFANEKAYKTQLFNEMKQDLKLPQIQVQARALAQAQIDIGPIETTRLAGRFAMPAIALNFSSLLTIFALALTLAAIGLIESLMTLTLIDELTETRGNGNRECMGQGIANIVSGFFGSMGGCAMIGQSMINIRSGGRSRLSGISAALFLLCFIVFPPLWGFIGKIPVASLIGVMFIVVIEFKDCRAYDHSALEAISTISQRYNELGKKIRLRHLSTECQKLLKKADDIIEVDLYTDPKYHIATNITP
jgi:MFS superfamily sulfate permease-like transporter